MAVNPQRVAVTGAASGIGAATVARLRRDGRAVAAIDLAPAPPEVEAEFHAVADVADPSAIRAAIDASAEALGGLDGLVCCAGVVFTGTVEEFSDEDWERQFAVNTGGVFFAARAALPHLRRAGGGAIVAISSQLAISAVGELAAYCASKAAVNQLVRCMAIDHSHEGIRVNAVCPGITRTAMYQGWVDEQPDDAARDAKLRADMAKTLHNRIIEPDEIAAAVSFLVSDESPSILGEALVVDGGYVIP
ncbi:MAG: hypothetical protein QOI62_2442 [Solirubrobacteraceae bacterium]|jgi:NAD(P)-dependent dehydrogenase (short-subunit alcohol dehydrogenase family)|nr:hypothetical protein [Solirubrobacteraceae bacterium]MEA2359182.1 hypothetical protein [Solirubrobacteraceae bacterium]